MFYKSYPDFATWQENQIFNYMNAGIKIKLPCVAEGVEIFTNSGKKEIQELLPEDLIWDGENFVKHGGLVQRGEKDIGRRTYSLQR